MRRLTAKEIKEAIQAKKKVVKADEKGLYFYAFKSGKASWYFRVHTKENRKQKAMKIGEYPEMGIIAARKKAAELWARRNKGEDVFKAPVQTFSDQQEGVFKAPVQTFSEKWKRPVFIIRKPKGEEVDKEPTPAAADEAIAQRLDTLISEARRMADALEDVVGFCDRCLG